MTFRYNEKNRVCTYAIHVSRKIAAPGSQIVGSARTLERERKNKTRGISRSFCQFALSPLSRSLEQATRKSASDVLHAGRQPEQEFSSFGL